MKTNEMVKELIASIDHDAVNLHERILDAHENSRKMMYESNVQVERVLSIWMRIHKFTNDFTI